MDFKLANGARKPDGQRDSSVANASNCPPGRMLCHLATADGLQDGQWHAVVTLDRSSARRTQASTSCPSDASASWLPVT